MRWADGDNSLQLYRVYALNPCQETEHTLRGDTGNRRIEPSPLTERLSPLCLSICVYKAMCVCVLLFDDLCTDGVCLSVLLCVCLFSFENLSACEHPLICLRADLWLYPPRLARSAVCQNARPFSALVHVDIGGSFLIEGLLNQSTLLNPPRSKTNWERLYQRSQFSMKRVLLCIN